MRFSETWESLNSREIPEWYDNAKLGIFIHWGIYSVPAYAPKGQYAEWYGWNAFNGQAGYEAHHKRVYGENFCYNDFAPMWKAEMFDAGKWAKLFKRAGAKYVVLVSKHHDAFCLWKSRYSTNWNSVDIGPKRDFVHELFEAVREQGMKPGVYYSLYEWYHPLLTEKKPEEYADAKMIPEMKELVNAYRPSILYTDGEWDYTSEEWHSKEFLAWLFNESVVKDEIVVNDRWGKDCRGVNGGYLSCEYGEVNSGALDEETAQKNLMGRKWEETRSTGMSFGANRSEEAEDYLKEDELIELLVKTVSKGGNLLLNVGPNADGTIMPLVEERLIQLGDWLKVNGEAIYDTAFAGLSLSEGAYATKKGDKTYVIFRLEPDKKVFIQKMKVRSAKVLGHDAALKIENTSEGCEIQAELKNPILRGSGFITVEIDGEAL